MMRKHIYVAIVCALLVGNVCPMKSIRKCLGRPKVHPVDTVGLQVLPVDVVKGVIIFYLEEKDLVNLLTALRSSRIWREILPMCYKNFPLVCVHSKLCFMGKGNDVLWKKYGFSKKKCAYYAARNDFYRIIERLFCDGNSSRVCFKEKCRECLRYCREMDHKIEGIPAFVCMMIKYDASKSLQYLFEKTNFIQKYFCGGVESGFFVIALDYMCVLAIQHGSTDVHGYLVHFFDAKVGVIKDHAYSFLSPSRYPRRYTGTLSSGSCIGVSSDHVFYRKDFVCRSGGSLVVLAYYGAKDASKILKNIVSSVAGKSFLTDFHVDYAIKVAIHRKNKDVEKGLKKLKAIRKDKTGLKKLWIKLFDKV